MLKSLFKKRSLRDTSSAVDENARLKALTAEADSLAQSGDAAGARARYEDVLRADPGDLYATYQLATLLHEQGALDAARQVCDDGLARAPEQLGLRFRRATISKAGGDYYGALNDLLRIREADPAFPDIDTLLGDIYYFLGRGPEAVAAFDRAIARNPDATSIQSDRLFLLNFFKLQDRAALFEEHRKWGALHEARLRPLRRPWDNDRDPDRRLRVGYVSADLRQHAVAFFIEGVLREHDRNDLEVHCFDVSPFPEDHVTVRLRQYVDAWHRVGALDDDAIAALIRSERIDVLVDLSGHTAHNRLLVFARKPAPVQVSWFGYMNTTGLTAMDYRITDGYLDPPGEADSFYTETLVRMAGMACFTPAPESPPISPLPALTAGVFTFASVNQWTKVTGEVKDVWAAILRESPGFRLLIVAKGAENPRLRDEIVREFVDRGATAAQIAVFSTRPLGDFLRLYEQIDVVLDPFPYGGGTTSLHTVWMGVPIVTLEGESELSRACAGIVRVLELHDFVAASAEEYRRIAVGFGNAPAAVAAIRQSLRERMGRSTLTDASAVARNLASNYRSIWHKYCAGEKIA